MGFSSSGSASRAELGQNQGPETQSKLSTWVAGPQLLELPKVHVSRDLESEMELGLAVGTTIQNTGISSHIVKCCAKYLP